MRRLQRVAFWIAIVAATLGFLSSTGCQLGPAIPRQSLGFLHVVLFFFGAAAGCCAILRVDEIDRERWRIVEDPDLTHGERDYAHKHAERQRRSACTAFLAAPLMLGYWWAYQVEGAGSVLASQLLPVSAMIGAILGWFVSRWWIPRMNSSASDE